MAGAKEGTISIYPTVIETCYLATGSVILLSCYTSRHHFHHRRISRLDSELVLIKLAGWLAG